MANTFRRRPIISDTDLAEDVEHSYANFASFKGLCDDKNYIGIDQQTLEDCNNVYIDTDGQLSSRPKLKQIINVLPENYDIVKVFNIHGKIFYHVLDRTYNKYYVYMRWSTGDAAGELVSWSCGEHLNIAWFTDKFYFFTDNNIFTFFVDASGTEHLSNTAYIYVPITEEIRNGVAIDVGDDVNIDDKNIFTNAEYVRYIYSSTSTVPFEQINKEGDITINGERYRRYIDKDTKYILVTNICQFEITNAGRSSAGNIIAWNDEYPSVIYYSDDGDIFTSLPSVSNSKEGGSEPVLSQDGSRIYVLNSVLTPDGDTFNETYTIWWMDTSARTYWHIFNKTLTKLGLLGEYAINNKLYGTEYVYKGFNSKAIGYSNDGDVVVFIRRATYNIRHGDGAYIDLNSVVGVNVYSFNGVNGYDCFSVKYDTKDSLNNGGSASNGYAIVIPCTHELNVSCATYNNRTYTSIYSVYNNKLYRQIIVLDKNCKPYALYGTDVYANLQQNQSMISEDIRYDLNYRNLLFNANSTLQDNIDIVSYRIVENGSNVDIISKLVYAKNNYICVRDDTSTISQKSNSTTTDFIQAYDLTKYGNFDVWFNCSDKNVDDYSLFYVAPYGGYSIKFKSNYNVATDTLSILYSPPSQSQNSLRIYKNKQLDVNTTLLHNYGNVIPISADIDAGILYIYRNTLYGINLNNEITIDVSKYDTADFNYIIPSFVCEFTNGEDVIAYYNKICWRTPETDESGNGLLYFKKINEISFPSKVTGLTLLSQTEVAIFFENEVRILRHTDNGNILERSKLQLGCKDGYDVMLNYDGSTVLLCTLKGLSALSYQDFVQSTDQIFTYLSENIIDSYEKYAVSPIKLYQYKNWIVMYRQDSKVCYIYDLRNSSWWKWSCNHNLQQVIFDNEKLLILIEGKLYNLVSGDKEIYYDMDYEDITWSLRSQKLHFAAPNNYKHINQLVILSTQKLTESFKFYLKFMCYRNLLDVTDKEAQEYEVDGLKTFIKRMNFMKVNAFQFELSNYKNQDKPRQFVTPNIAIKYRITERVR